MASDFSLLVDFGPNAPATAISSFFRSMGVVCETAERLAQAQVEQEAEVDVRRELLTGRPEDAIAAFATYLGSPADVDEFRQWMVSARSWQFGVVEPEDMKDVRGELRPTLEGWRARLPQVASRVVSARILERYPDPVRVVHVTYENPLELVLGALGAVIYTLSALLKVIRDFGPRRRIAAAGAAEAEDLASVRSALRRELLQRHIRGQIQANPDDLMKLVSDDPLRALYHLSSLDTHVSAPDQIQSE